MNTIVNHQNSINKCCPGGLNFILINHSTEINLQCGRQSNTAFIRGSPWVLFEDPFSGSTHRLRTSSAKQNTSGVSINVHTT